MYKALDSDGNRVNFTSLGHNGSIKYSPAALREENPLERERRGSFWRSLGKKIAKGSRIK